jgi:hypothetical protein
MREAGTVTVALHVQPKWWMRPAVVASAIALKLGLIRDAESAAHFGGIITAEERVAKWLTDFAFRIEVR